MRKPQPKKSNRERSLEDARAALAFSASEIEKEKPQILGSRPIESVVQSPKAITTQDYSSLLKNDQISLLNTTQDDYSLPSVITTQESVSLLNTTQTSLLNTTQNLSPGDLEVLAFYRDREQAGKPGFIKYQVVAMELCRTSRRSVEGAVYRLKSLGLVKSAFNKSKSLGGHRMTVTSLGHACLSEEKSRKMLSDLSLLKTTHHYSNITTQDYSSSSSSSFLKREEVEEAWLGDWIHTLHAYGVTSEAVQSLRFKNANSAFVRECVTNLAANLLAGFKMPDPQKGIFGFLRNACVKQEYIGLTESARLKQRAPSAPPRVEFERNQRGVELDAQWEARQASPEGEAFETKDQEIAAKRAWMKKRVGLPAVNDSIEAAP